MAVSYVCRPVTGGADYGKVTSTASTQTDASLAAAVFSPVVVICKVCLPGARPLTVHTGTWTASVAAYRSSRPNDAPSSATSAIPATGERNPIHLTPVPVKVNVARAPAVAESAADPLPLSADVPLQVRVKSPRAQV